MLISSLKPGHSLIIGPITVVVTEVRGTRAIIGVEAPKDMKIIRSCPKDEHEQAPRSQHQETQPK